jgi:hypothetical protein
MSLHTVAILCLALVFGFGHGCSTPKPDLTLHEPPPELDVLSELTAISPFGDIIITDNAYLCISPRDEKVLWWIPAEAPPYWPEAWDCDDIAIETLQLWKKAMIFKLLGNNAGLCAGVIAVNITGPFVGYSPTAKEVKAGGYNHALLLYRRGTGEWMAYDPQSGMVEGLLKAVRDGRVSVYFIWL